MKLNICEIQRMIKTMCEATIYSERNQIYLKKHFREQLRSNIEIMINKENEKEIIIKETGEGRCKTNYYSKEIVKEISNTVNKIGNLQFVFLYDLKEKIWRGVLIPNFEESYLWNELKNQPQESNKYEQFYEEKKLIVTIMKRRYWSIIEYEEIEFLYSVACRLTQMVYPHENINGWNYLIACLLGLMRETLSAQRKIKKVESRLSLNTFVGRKTRCEYQEFLGSTDAVDESLVVEEFKSQLTPFEKLILNWRIRNIDLENNISIGYYFQEHLIQSLENMKEKAYEYFGKDYVRSFFEIRVA